MNTILLSTRLSINPTPNIDFSLNNLKKLNDCNNNKSNHINNDNQTIINVNKNNNNDDICNFNKSISHKVYLYSLPYDLRERPRKHWYEMFNKDPKGEYDIRTELNFGFGNKLTSYLHDDFYSTHMHSLEIILNERFKNADYYLTNNSDNALLFHIPFAFAQHYRYYHRSDQDSITPDHNKLYNLISNTSIYVKYFNKKPHFITYGRIAYETGRLDRAGSKFWSINNGYVDIYWHVSIDRNCHGDPPSCIKRISMPHPSNFHPLNILSLKKQIDRNKQSYLGLLRNQKRDVLVSFCGAIRTPLRKKAKENCNSIKWTRWSQNSGYRVLCEFKDSVKYENKLKNDYNINNQHERKRRIEIKYGKECIDLYDKSIFCLQDGADSTTRKALWDGIVSGCIPVFLSGVMTTEFECFGGNLYPWYIILQPQYYIKQLMSLSNEYIKLLQKNILRLIPKIIYTNGNAGFCDAFDVLLHCLIRKTSAENQIDNPGCTNEHIVDQRKQLYNFDKILGYDKLYKYLEI